MTGRSWTITRPRCPRLRPQLHLHQHLRPQPHLQRRLRLHPRGEWARLTSSGATWLAPQDLDHRAARALDSAWDR